jgi:hypothetical protein
MADSKEKITQEKLLELVREYGERCKSLAMSSSIGLDGLDEKRLQNAIDLTYSNIEQCLGELNN